MKNETTPPLAHLLDGLQEGYGLPQPFYVDHHIFEEELEAIWKREWIVAGMGCELEKPGSWFTVNVGNASVIVCKDAGGQLNAFHNTCRHRGSRICTTERGASRNFTCPYHQWTYASNGELIFAKDMGPDFDKSQFSLKRVHLKNASGYLFICLAQDAPDFDHFIESVAPYLLPHDLENAKIAHESTIIEKANWKLVLENNRECYHCKGSHPELLRTIAEVEDTSDPKCSAAYRDKALSDEQRWQAQGLAYRLLRTGPGWQIVRVPMAKGVSFTMTGAPASKRLMGELPDFDVGSVRLLHFPNTWNHALGDHAISFRVLPIDANTTAVTTKWLVHKDAVAGLDYELDDLIAVWNATNNQDRTLAENNQLGISGPGYQPGPYSTEMEPGVLAFMQWYQEKMRKHTQRMQAVPQTIAAASAEA